MAKVKITGHASGSGVITVTAPNTSTDRTITLPDATATLSTFNPDGAVVINESGADVDFRVESDTASHALCVDGALGNVGIGESAPESKLSLKSGSYAAPFGVNVGTFADSYINLHSTTANNEYSQLTFGYDGASGANAAAYMGFQNKDTGAQGKGDLVFGTRAVNTDGTAPLERLRITSDGRGLSQFTAKAWCNFHGTGTIAINDSHNVSSLTDVGEGNYRVNFSNAMANANYSYSGAVGDWDVVVTGNTPNTAYAPVYVINIGSHNQQDKNYVMIQVFGD